MYDVRHSTEPKPHISLSSVGVWICYLDNSYFGFTSCEKSASVRHVSMNIMTRISRPIVGGQREHKVCWLTLFSQGKNIIVGPSILAPYRRCSVNISINSIRKYHRSHMVGRALRKIREYLIYCCGSLQLFSYIEPTFNSHHSRFNFAGVRESVCGRVSSIFTLYCFCIRL